MPQITEGEHAPEYVITMRNLSLFKLVAKVKITKISFDIRSDGKNKEIVTKKLNSIIV